MKLSFLLFVLNASLIAPLQTHSMREDALIVYDSHARTIADCETASPTHLRSYKPLECATRSEISCCKTTLASGVKRVRSVIRTLDDNHVCRDCTSRDWTQTAPALADMKALSLWRLSSLEMSRMSDPGTAQVQRREVHFPCEITNPKRAQSCNPQLCGSRWDVHCLLKQHGLNECTGLGMRVKENQDVCKGCKCGIRRDYHRKKPASSRDRRRKKELEDTADSGDVRGTDVAPVQRREVREPCAILKIGRSPNCYPQECSKRWGVHCVPTFTRKTMDLKCIGAGLRDFINKDVCGDCKCRMQSKKENDQFVSSVANKTPHPELARYKKRVKTFGNGENSKTALGSEPGGIQRRLVADGCEIYNADGPRTCNPLLCNQQRFIFCSRGQTTTTPEKRRCGGYGFELPHYDHICRGCRCRTLPPPRKPRPRLPVPSKDESKEGEGRPQIKWPKVQAEQDKPPASETNQLQRRLVADGCEIYNPEDLPTCKPAECSQQESITCSRPLMRRCVGNGFQLMLYEHVCKGCACRSIPRPQSLHYRENRKRPLLLLPGPEGSPNGTDSQTERPKTRHMHPPEPAEGKGLHHRAVTHPCEISNPNHLDTCKPAQCGAHPLIRCFPSGRHSSTCQSRGLSEEAVDHICRGCWCSRKGSEKAVKAPNDNGMCEVINPRNRPTCNPLACAAHPLVSCSGFPNAHRCRGKGMNNSQVKDICYGCVCALKAGSPPPPRVWKPLGRKPKRPAVVAGGLERNVKLKTGDLESRLGDPSLKGSRGQELAATYFFTGNLGRKALGLPPLPKKEIDVIVKSKSGRMKYSEREIEKDVESKSRRTKYSEKERQI